MKLRTCLSATLLLAVVSVGAGSQLAAFSFLQLFGISEEEEIAIGQQAAQQVEREMRLVHHPAVRSYVQRIGDRLVRYSGRSSLRYRFEVVDDSEPNAFALPGGYIYIHRGILELSRNESEFAGVTAHEIGHVAERHSVEQIQKAQVAGLGLGVLGALLGRDRSQSDQLVNLGAGLFTQGLFFRFSRNAEREADRVAVSMLRQARIDPSGMVSLFQRMEQLQRHQPSRFETFFSTHPSLSERQQNISQLLRSSDSRLSSNSAEFQRVHRLLTRR